MNLFEQMHPAQAAPPEKAPVRRRDRRQTTLALLDAGIRVFARRGYDAATTREVAQEAGVNEQLIQRYFGGKSGLLLAITRRFAEDEHECAPQWILGSGDLEAEISRFLHLQLDHERDKKDFAKVVLYRAIVDPEVAGEVGRHLADARIPHLCDRLRDLRDAGLVDPRVDLEAAAHALSTFSLALGLIDQVIFGIDQSRIEAAAAFAARIFSRGLATTQGPASADAAAAASGGSRGRLD